MTAGEGGGLAMDGGFRPPKEAREIEAALDALNRAVVDLYIMVHVKQNEALLRWLKAQGGQP